MLRASLDVLVSARVFWGYFCAERPVLDLKIRKDLTLSFQGAERRVFGHDACSHGHHGPGRY